MTGQSSLPGTVYKVPRTDIRVFIVKADYPTVQFRHSGGVALKSLCWQEFFRTFSQVKP